jgi:phosphate transport system substrate-binding protein
MSIMGSDERFRSARGIYSVLGLIAALLIGSAVATLPSAAGGVVGSMIIAGNGPELETIEQLVHAFEKRHLGAVVEIRWDAHSDPVKLINSGVAEVVVSGRPEPNLSALTIAWDGIAVVVYIGNPMKDVTSQQVAAIFSGKVRRWGQLSGQDLAIHLIDRAQNQQIRQSFEESLGIVGQIPTSARRISSDQSALSMVAGSISAVAYASLRPALEAVMYGVDITLLTIDGVEAAEETVKDGRYRLRRPVLLLSGKARSPVSEAFAIFALSEEGQRIIGERFTPLQRGPGEVHELARRSLSGSVEPGDKN